MKASKGAPGRGRLFFALLLAPLLFPASALQAQSEGRPNIVIVMADDHAQWALGAYGLEQIDTPNIDFLAEQGVLFTNAMSPAPVCSSARASFYTGKMPSQHGVHDFLSESAEYDANWLAGQIANLRSRASIAGSVMTRCGQAGKTSMCTAARCTFPPMVTNCSIPACRRGS
jgi:hypothetical protein